MLETAEKGQLKALTRLTAKPQQARGEGRGGEGGQTSRGEAWKM